MTFIPAPGAPQQPLNRGHVGRGLIVAAICLLPSGVFAQVTVGPPIRIDVGGSTFAANETTVSASDANPLEIIAGWNDWRRSGSSELINAAFSLSMDGGQTWTDFLIRPPTPNQSGVEGDPMTAADPRTGTLWAGAISFSAGSNSGIFVARKDPGETTFHPAVMARTSNGTDKCWMAAGPRPGLPDTTRLYVAYNEGVIWSDNMGDTWTSPVSLGSGLGFLPRIGPNGELYIVYWDGGTGMKRKLQRRPELHDAHRSHAAGRLGHAGWVSLPRVVPSAIHALPGGRSEYGHPLCSVLRHDERRDGPA